jgi:signal peptidase I
MSFLQKHGINKRVKQFTTHWRYLLHVDDDLLNEKQKNTIVQQINAVSGSTPENVSAVIDDANTTILRVLPKKSFPLLREYLDVIAVAVVVAFGIRGLFLQPFKIPTSSMQPTLYGIHFISDSKRLSSFPAMLSYPLFASRNADLTIKTAGRFDYNSVRYNSGVFDKTSFVIGDTSYTLPGEPVKVFEYSGVMPDKFYSLGEKLCKGWLSLGDHLFVDRFSHHLTGLSRGDIVVFNTEGIVCGGIKLADNGYYYIKRLVGLPGDRLKIVNNKLWIKPKNEDKFRDITEFSPKFAKIYSGKGGYHGHLNLLGGEPAEYLGDSESTIEIPADSYFMMGDNSMFSSDSRRWGTVPRKNIVGKACFVFWPFSRRWGMTDRAEPVDVPTDQPGRHTFKSMSVQY